MLRLLLRAGRLAERVADHLVLLVAAGDLRDPRTRQRALDEVGEAVAVPLQEGRALRLAVIGEHDDLVRPGRVLARALDAAELLIELPERLERVGALEARVVRDLVVAREGGVHRGPPLDHVRDHAVHDQVAHEDAHRRPEQRVDPAAVPARADVAADRTEGRHPLEHDLPEDEHEHAGDVEAVREERAVARVGSLLRLHPAGGEDHVVGLAREAGCPGSHRRSAAGPCRSRAGASISAQSAGPEHA